MSSTRGPYAQGTDVPVDRSIAEMRRLLASAGEVRFATEEGPARYSLMAELGGRWYAFHVDRPDWHDWKQFFSRGSLWERTEREAEKMAAAEHRRRWRVLCFLLKAKVVATEDGTVDEGDGVNEDLARELIPYVMLPDKSTVGDHFEREMAAFYASGRMPRALPAPGEGEE